MDRPQIPRENAIINELIREYLEYNGCVAQLVPVVSRFGSAEHWVKSLGEISEIIIQKVVEISDAINSCSSPNNSFGGHMMAQMVPEVS